ncbi:MAG: MFS transporter [Spirochaetes bacterium]|nr:MFS transporter [Spirochaetota bacterium]
MATYHIETLPLWKKIMYALGQFGWSLGSFSVGNLLVYFYLPPENGQQTIFPPFIYQGYVFGVLTIIGIIFAFGRLWDAITDPLIAGLSDRSKSSFGRRRTFLAIGAFPFALLSVLAFIPPMKTVHMINVIWLFVVITLFYWFMTMYVTPFFAWMSELGHSPRERLFLSTLISITWALGFATGSQAPALQTYFEKTMNSVQAFQLTVTVFAVISLIFMYLPVIFIDERRYCEPNVSSEGTFQAVISAFKNKGFLFFTLSDLTYWTALTFITTGLVYYVTVLLKLEKEVFSQLMIVLFALSFIFYVPVNLIAQRLGKKRLLVIAFILYALVFVIVFPLGKWPISPIIQAYALIAWASLPLAIFGILPNAIIADIAEADGIKTGNFKAGIFFGARTFMSKMGQMLGALLFPSLLLLGKSHENDIGVRLTGVVAFAFCAVGLILFLKYDEKDVLKTLATKEQLSEEELQEISS